MLIDCKNIFEGNLHATQHAGFDGGTNLALFLSAQVLPVKFILSDVVVAAVELKCQGDGVKGIEINGLGFRVHNPVLHDAKVGKSKSETVEDLIKF